MSLEELREQNKENVAACALEHFIQNGIEPSKISDIAKKAGVTSRSVYRYFETKADLVLQAALLFWEQTVAESEKVWDNPHLQSMSGASQIEAVLKAYAHQYVASKEKLVFIQEAEVYLHRNGKIAPIQNKAPINFLSGKGPLNRAVHKGIMDGTVKNSPNLELLYYNAYDSLLGLMQKMAVGDADDWQKNCDGMARIDAFCEMLARSFSEQ